MANTYEVIVCGTGLVECLLARLLCQAGIRVLHINRSSDCGNKGASLNIDNVRELLIPNQNPPPELGRDKSQNIDLISKCVIRRGKMVKILQKTGVSGYLKWRDINATYVLQAKEKGFSTVGETKIEKVPTTAREALDSDLIGLYEKRRCHTFLSFLEKFDPKTHHNFDVKHSANMFQHFGLEYNTIEFLGHAVCLYTDRSFMQLHAHEVIDRIKLFLDSVRASGGSSPFIYSVQGLAGIRGMLQQMNPVNKGVVLLDTDVTEIKNISQKTWRVQTEKGRFECKKLICDPTYALKSGLKDRVRLVEKVIRCICILDHQIQQTNGEPSMRIIIPQRQVGRKNDINIMLLSEPHSICNKGAYIAIISTTAEALNPVDDIESALKLIGPVREMLLKTHDRYEPTSEDIKDRLYITKSFEAIDHFQNQADDVLRLYREITGKELDLTDLLR